MSDERILAVLFTYEQKLREMGCEPKRTSLNTAAYDEGGGDHLLWMVCEMRKFLLESRREKLMRWLSFVQGALWWNGDYSITDLMKHVKPPEESFDANR